MTKRKSAVAKGRSKLANAISQHRGSLGDEWETPWPVFHFIEKQLGVTFTTDVCANPRMNNGFGNTKVVNYMTKEFGGSALDIPWKAHAYETGKEYPCVAFCNPPYSNISGWLHKAAYETIHGTMSAVLVKADTGTKWFHKYAPLASDIAFMAPRVNYIPPKGVKASSNSHGSMVLVYRPNRKPNQIPNIHFWQWKEPGRRS